MHETDCSVLKSDPETFLIYVLNCLKSLQDIVVLCTASVPVKLMLSG